jgi:hypothetical protein
MGGRGVEPPLLPPPPASPPLPASLAGGLGLLTLLLLLLLLLAPFARAPSLAAVAGSLEAASFLPAAVGPRGERPGAPDEEA